ncbi:MAG: dCTP deaminase [bacterium]
MIFTGKEIEKEVDAGRIIIDPFEPSHITTNSYDLTLGDSLLRYTEKVLDPKKNNKYEEINIAKEGMILPKGSFHLGCSVERIGSNFCVPIIHARSGMARLGLFVHVTADLIDIGSIGVTTFQLYATLPIRIYPGMKIAQVSFWQPKGEIELYKGKYQNSKSPRASLSYLDKSKF